MPVSEAEYQSIQLGNRWFHSLDYKHRQSSMTVAQSKVDNSGLIHYVISQKDPGVWNWLDTDGLEKGLIMLRWQGTNNPPESKMDARIINLSETKSVLPSTHFISPEDRKAQLKHRAESIAKRFQ